LLEILVCFNFDKISSKDRDINEKSQTRVEVVEEISNTEEVKYE